MLLNVSNLSKKFAEHTAVNDISFSINEGRCIALLGPNGAGKTTTLKMLTGLLEPSAGSIEFVGMRQGEDLRQFIGFLPQHPAFYNWMTGREFLEYVGKLSHLSKEEAVTRANHLLELVGIADAKNRRIAGYSGGMKQRLGIAQALIHGPKLLMLDEPVSALDPVGRRDVLDMLREIKKDTTILFSTHVLHDAEGISDDVLIINHGEIVMSGQLNDIRSKHQQPVITLEMMQIEVADEWMQRWKEHRLVLEMVKEQRTVKLVVSDLDSAQKLILQDIVENNIAIHKFEVAQTTLEDLFMKAVSS